MNVEASELVIFFASCTYERRYMNTYDRHDVPENAITTTFLTG